MLDGRLTLDSFSAGESIRMFQTKIDGQPVVLDAFNSNEAKPILLSSDDLDFHYFMKDATDVRLENSFSSGFIEFCKENINNEESDLYYNKLNISLLSSVSMAQAGRKTYVLGNDKYEEADSLSTYSLYQLYNLDQDNAKAGLNEAISAYIGSTYSSSYYDVAHYVDCKSVPVYSVNKDLVESLEIVTFNNKSDVLDFLHDFGKEFMLSGVSSMMCFNLETFSVDAENFDSMLVEPVIKRIARIYRDDENALKDAFSRCFNWIFSRLPKKSFLRMLNKIGSLTEIDSGQGDIRNSNKENEYLYSIDLKAKTRDIPVNYFSLKNLKNPEDLHDYVVKDIDYKSVKTVHNDMTQTVCANLFNIYNDTVMSKINRCH